MQGSCWTLYNLNAPNGRPCFLRVACCWPPQAIVLQPKMTFAVRCATRAPRITFPDDLQPPDLARIFATMQRQPAKGATMILWLGVVRDLACPSTAPGAQDLCAGPNGQGLMPLAHRQPWALAAP